MDEKDFSIRLSIIREQKNISARNLSLQLNKNPGYINKLEAKQVFPSMEMFFQICRLLEITPTDFFNTDIECPEEIKKIITNLQKLDAATLSHIAAVIDDLANSRN